VTCELLAARFGVHPDRMRARIRRLEQLGLVLRACGLPNQAAAVYLTAAGACHIGIRRRRPPRPDMHREHELALIGLVCRLELRRPDLRVLTERDARDLELTSQQRLSVDVVDGQGRTVKRWPDVILADAQQTAAIEVEFAAKSSQRLRGILRAYIDSPMSQVHYLVSSPALAARLQTIAAQETSGARMFNPQPCPITIAPWHQATPTAQAAIKARLAA